MKKAILSMLIASALAGCGGGGSGSTAVAVAQSAPLSVETLYSTKRVSLGVFNTEKESEYTGSDSIWVNLLTAGDINGDGHDDLVLGLFRVDKNNIPSGSIKPVVLFFDPATGQYKINSQLQSVLSKHQHPRQAVLVDVDGDGRLDIFIADHGYDDGPFGAQNSLILNKPSGFVNSTVTLPQYADYSHGLVVADFDLNGKKDLLVLNNTLSSDTKCQLVSGFTDCENSSGQRVEESYVLFNNGQSLTRGQLTLAGASDINFTATTNDRASCINVGTAADLNKDGIPDLVIADHSQIKIIESTSVLNYKNAVIISANSEVKKTCLTAYTPYTFVLAKDLDGDGIDEIIASYSCETGLNQQFQVIKKVAGIWQDSTSKFFPSQAANFQSFPNWCYKILFEDVDNDGIEDLVCNSGAGFGWPANNVFWLFKNGAFEYKDIQLENRRPSGWHTPVTINNQRYIIGLNLVDKTVEVVAWKIK